MIYTDVEATRNFTTQLSKDVLDMNDDDKGSLNENTLEHCKDIIKQIIFILVSVHHLKSKSIVPYCKKY